jgi:hypothetical protein
MPSRILIKRLRWCWAMIAVWAAVAYAATFCCAVRSAPAYARTAAAIWAKGAPVPFTPVARFLVKTV